MPRRRDAFTLIELMIVVGIIALLALIAVPSFLRARQRAQNAKFINALRIASGAFDTYAMEHNSYPPDVNRGIVPPGMAPYFGPSMNWTASTPIGGQWDWDKDVFGFKAGISVVNSNASQQQWLDIDTAIDNGDLFSGAFQDKSSRYTFILE
ncbi:MAG: type II secretion system GspH family protein [Verrucomicrobiota bacterium]|nr:type II secretion system GspH family protein [Verrucomicrobiota bacterium]